MTSDDDDSTRRADCPAWCDGQHGADDDWAVFHGLVVAARGGATVALACAVSRDPREPVTGPVIVLDAGAAGTLELDAVAAVRLLAMLQAGGDGRAWLAGTMRSALRLLSSPDLDTGTWAGSQ